MAAPAPIENPVLNSPFRAPTRHFKSLDNGDITNEIVDTRRPSAYWVAVPQPHKHKAQPSLFDDETRQQRREISELINAIRNQVERWRRSGYPGITTTTRRLLEYWTNPEREKKLFFCQIEAVETAIFLAEGIDSQGDKDIERRLQEQSATYNPGLPRIAFKMATGSGKTVVMAMLIAWHTLNKRANPQDTRFADAFLIVTPGITIRDRLRVLLPNDPGNYYRERDLVPPQLAGDLQYAKIVITNFHAFGLRETIQAGKLTKSILASGPNSQAANGRPGNGRPGNGGPSNGGAFTETPDQMVRRVLREILGNRSSKRAIVVINDEAHHCYGPKPSNGNGGQGKDGTAQGEEGAAQGQDAAPAAPLTTGVTAADLKGDERKEAEKREQEARIWLNGLLAVKRKLGVKLVYDLSATPFFLRGSGYPEGTLFPWVVSDFSLIDAIESGIVKVPRVPVADNAGTGDQPVYRNLWPHIREHLPRKGRGTEAVTGEPKLPKELEGALRTLYANYKLYYDAWLHQSEPHAASTGGAAAGESTGESTGQSTGAIRYAGATPPVFIVVCNNTNVSNLVYRFIAGWEKQVGGRTVVQAGALDLFRNDDEHGGWRTRPNTILVDSEQLETSGSMSPEFKAVAAAEIEEFKAEYRLRFPGRDVDKLTDEDLLREVLNTVGKPGKLGEHVRCVVSVSMLTEGWDANTVTHVLGVRAFGTQLLSEQVVGRALRRISYATDHDGKFPPEYAEVFGVPFTFIPTAGWMGDDPPPRVQPTRVRALPERRAAAITFPRLQGYRYDLPSERLSAEFTPASQQVLSSADLPTRTEMAAVVGESHTLTLDDLRSRRLNEVAFRLAELLLRKYFRTGPEDTANGPAGDTANGAANDTANDTTQDRPWLFPQALSIVKQWLAQFVTCKDGTFPQLLLLVENAHAAVDKIYSAIVQSNHGAARIQPILRPYDSEGTTDHVDFDTTRTVYTTDPARCPVSHCVLDSNWEGTLVERFEHMDEVVRYVKNFGLGFTIPYTFEGTTRDYVPDYIVCLDDGRGPADLLHLIVEVSGEARADKAAKVAAARNFWVPAVNNCRKFGRWAFIEITDPWEAEHEIRAAFLEKKYAEL